MKRVASFLISIILTLFCVIPAFAEDSAKFNITLVSETDTSAVITVDYTGGAKFACLDFDIIFDSDKFKVEKSIKGDGLRAFENYVQDNNGASISTSNVVGYTVKTSLATTIEFQNVSGKDLYKVTVKKLKAEKIKAGEITVNVTNCQTSEFKDVKTLITSDFGNSTGTTIASTSSNGGNSATTDKSTATATDAQGNIVTTASTDENGSTVTDFNEPQTSENGEMAQTEIANEGAQSSANVKKIIIIAAAALCALIVIAAIIFYVVKKSKNVEVETGEDPFEEKEVKYNKSDTSDEKDNDE